MTQKRHPRVALNVSSAFVAILPTAGTRETGVRNPSMPLLFRRPFAQALAHCAAPPPAINDNDGLIAIGQRASQLRLMVDVHFKAFFSLAC